MHDKCDNGKIVGLKHNLLYFYIKEEHKFLTFKIFWFKIAIFVNMQTSTCTSKSHFLIGLFLCQIVLKTVLPAILTGIAGHSLYFATSL